MLSLVVPEAERPQAILHVMGLRKNYASLEVLKGIDLSVNKGEVLCLIGPSGSGKSTILRCVALLEKYDSGLITLDDQPLGVDFHKGRLRETSPKNLRRQRIRMGMVFQHFNLFGHMTVLSNIIEAPMSVKGMSWDAAVALARSLLERVGLKDKENSYPNQLSGGQQQRVAIARAMAMQPDVLLFDEPTSALDPELVGEVLTVLTDLARSGVTMIVATHEMSFARDVADNVAFLQDGTIVEYGNAKQVITAPAHARTQAFLKRVLAS
ncbi:amino acid ABC transporter ATP-binding protein [Agrobacterium tumefaciens]|uniref:Amino acid ABC transporter ATP-binding protein n=1 Tax=Agrobacterium tumefaciens TaxID=358 RepID=A0AAP9EAP6_AGRTU|nr:amino acid ABC transporter ATP-binding protein [Agrobacterium tumefaciens]NSZ60139.1 amino acid ABC transporter ATP-binding protein [Agrobacterium tumefaciens]QDY97734.1 amino acid ABC transporter ATP-binding protein [Agrobacterium tumefaciens]UXS12857.1 amino acid ABC transporter ATP-binding protein [Agrobacterium tumefaciens]UXS20219.1 amino acid ABC transporter ATP-binding protein [Agrobacterium tumefaciens]UXS27865.1 amino acid ABC transporter ATP-binding protein [Agrobacterium tumefaci